MNIPKKIHYCWFGRKPLSKDAKKCIKSWIKYCPDYEVIRWDESNFDVTQHPYMEEAYKARKWAFVTDIARLIIIYQYGGIYFDTDVELIKPIDFLFDYSGFMGFEGNRIATGLGFGFPPQHPMVKSILEGYNGAHFINEDGSFDQMTCPKRNTIALQKHGVICDGSYQIIDGVHFLPQEYLCPMDWKTHEYTLLTDNTISIHHYSDSWTVWYRQHKYYNKSLFRGPKRAIYEIAKLARKIEWKKEFLEHKK